MAIVLGFHHGFFKSRLMRGSQVTCLRMAIRGVAPAWHLPHPLGKCPGVGGSRHISINNGPVQRDVETQKRKQLVVPKAIRECFQEEEAPECVLGR